MTQQYQIALDPALDITPQAFLAAWLAHEASQQAGQVSMSQTTRSLFDPGTAALLLTTAVGIASSVVASLIYDTIKDTMPQKEPEVRQQTLPDGTKVIIVTIRKS